MFGQERVKKYAFINAKLRARISNIISDELLVQISKARSLAEAIRFLHDTSFQIIEDVYNRTGDLKLAELELIKKEIEIFRELEKYISGEVLEFVKGVTCRYEVENLKAALRLWFDRIMRKRNIEPLIGYLFREKIHYDLHVDQIINVDNIENIVDILAQTPYSKIIKDNASQLESTHHLFQLEVALDKYYYKQLFEKAKKLDRMDFDIIKRMLGIEVDIENISWLVRFRDFYKMTSVAVMENMIPYGYNLDKKALEDAFASGDSTEMMRNLISKKYGALSSMLSLQGGDSNSKLLLLTRLLDQIILYEVKKVKGGYPFTVGIIMVYFVLKKNEIKKIMTLLNAKYYNIDEERIKSVI